MDKKFITQKFEKELMVYNSPEDEVYILNNTARFIYENYSEGDRVDDIISRLKNNFDIKENKSLKTDIHKILKEFFDKGLIKSLPE